MSCHRIPVGVQLICSVNLASYSQAPSAPSPGSCSAHLPTRMPVYGCLGLALTLPSAPSAAAGGGWHHSLGGHSVLGLLLGAQHQSRQLYTRRMAGLRRSTP